MARTKGATSEKWWADAVRVAANREHLCDGKKRKRISIIADKLCLLAIEGDMAAIKEIGDRLDGRPTTTIAGAGDNGEFVFQQIGLVGVPSDNSKD